MFLLLSEGATKAARVTRHASINSLVISPTLLKATNAHGLNIMQNNGKFAGQLVLHTHIHLIPRFQDDGLKHWSHKKYKSGEAENLLKDIKKAMKE